MVDIGRSSQWPRRARLAAVTAAVAMTLAAVAAPAAAQGSLPPLPDHRTFSGAATAQGAVSLDWGDVRGADSYDVRFWDRDLYEYRVLAAGANSNGITLTFDGSSATVSGLPDDYAVYWFGVRARNTHGTSAWPAIGIVVTPYQPSEQPSEEQEEEEEEEQEEEQAEEEEEESGTPPSVCEAGSDPPSPVNVAVASAPIVVTSTTADYFVLYATFDVDGTALEYPVRVVLGNDGETTLAENVAALPPERYRVEKYSVSDPADIDGDCIDDITELNASETMNPVNPAGVVGVNDGTVTVPDQQTFEAFAYREAGGTLHLKFSVIDIDTDRPSVYFQNSNRFLHHPSFLDTIYPGWRNDGSVVRGMVIYDPELVDPNGSRGLYRIGFTIGFEWSFSIAERTYALVAATMPVLDDDLALWVRNEYLLEFQADLARNRASRVNVVVDDDVFGGADFLALNPGEGYGLLRSLGPDERPGSRDVVIYEALPNELPRVGGIISTVPQTPLSHVNLRALQDRVPNAFIAGALEVDAISDLIDGHVYYAVTDTGYSIRAATQAEVEQFYAASRPAEAQTPERDLTATEVTALSEVGFGDWDSFGVKAANVAVLATLGFAAGTVPDGFAVPFYFYDEFLKHNSLYDDIAQMLADPDFRTDSATKADELKKLRKKIKKADTPAWIDAALVAMHATFPQGTSLRYRSSTNNEDLPGFNGAGLYDSKTQHPDETEEDGISKSLKQVYASLWNYRAFIERDFHRVDHLSTAMGVLVHPNYSDEQVNGVAVSTDPAYGSEGTYYVNSQIGEDLVTNPEAHSVPEEVLLYADGGYTIAAVSNQVPSGQLLMTGDQLSRLRRHLATIHEHFAGLYDVDDGEQFAMEIEFKITSNNILAIKQARPWIFSDPPPDVDDTTENTDTALTASFEDVPATHDGNPFSFRVRFSVNVMNGFAELRDAMEVTGGTATSVKRVQARNDLWEINVTPDSPTEDVTVVLPAGRHCVVTGTICTFDQQGLSTRLEHTVERLLPQVPDRPTGKVLSAEAVDLEWNETRRAESYELQLLHGGQWTDLPTDGTKVAFDGAGATVRGLPAGDSFSFRVRALNSHGASEWSPHLLMPIKVVLEGALTASQDTNTFPVVSGYSALGGFGGSLAPDRFVFEGTTYNIVYLVHLAGGLWLGLDRELPADFTLNVGDSAYLGSDSMVAEASVESIYWWPSTRPHWLGEDPARVSLVLHPGVALGDRQEAPLTGYFRNIPTEHDASEDFSFRIRFNRRVATTADALRDHVLSVSGGVVSNVEAVTDEGLQWAVSVTPDAMAPTTITIRAGLDCEHPEALCTADRGRLFNPMKLTVQAKPNHQPQGTPTITGIPEAGQTLTANTSAISDADGLTSATFSYQWLTSNGTPITGATNPTYTLSDTDEGKTFKVKVTFTDDADNKETLTSARVTMKRPYALNATASNGAVSLTWQRPEGWPYTNTYEILRNRPELGETEPLVHIRYAAAPTLTYTDTDVEPGVLYVYRIRGVDLFGLTHEASQPAEIRTPEPAPTNKKPATDTTPEATQLTAEFLSTPASHDGQGPFTLELSFSEEFSLSYLALRDHAFTVTGGTVTSARRLAPPGNIRWEITILPDSDADVHIALSATQNCSDQGALCTGDGRMLSNDATLAVAGPRGQ